MREDLRRNLLAQKVVDKEVGEKATPSEADVKAFFDANKAQFNRDGGFGPHRADRDHAGSRTAALESHRR